MQAGSVIVPAVSGAENVTMLPMMAVLRAFAHRPPASALVD